MQTLRRLASQSSLQRRGGILQGCLIVLAILIVIVGIALFWVYMNWRSWTATLMVEGAKVAAAEFGLPDDQRDAVVAEIDKLAQDFKDKKISPQDLVRIMEDITEGPLLPMGGVLGAQRKFIEPSEMTTEEKEESMRSLQRFARGIHEKKIPHEAIEDIVKPVITLQPDGNWKFKDNPTIEEVRQFVANAKTKADEVDIPDEPFEVDIAAELRKAIDRVRGRSSN